MSRPSLPLVALALLGACAWLRPAPPPAAGDPVQELARADELARNGSASSARTLYRKVLREKRRTPVAAEALWGLGRLYVDPDGRLRDYGAARNVFGWLASEYPDSPRAPEARAWHAALGQLLQSQAEAQRLRGDLDRLKALDMEQERR